MRSLIGAAVLAAGLASFGAAQAAAVAIQNADFNEGYWVQEDGGFRAGHAGGNPPGWGASGGSGTGQWNPTAASFASEAAHAGVGWAHGNGLSNQGSAGMIAQTLAGYTIAANTRYTLTVDVGRRADASGPFGYQIGLLGGLLDGTGQIFAQLSEATSGVDIDPGAFGKVTLVFETGADNPFIGKQLSILLGGTGIGAAFDNASLDAAPLQVSAVPEPATWAMMIAGFGGVGAMLRSRRRQFVVA